METVDELLDVSCYIYFWDKRTTMASETSEKNGFRSVPLLQTQNIFGISLSGYLCLRKSTENQVRRESKALTYPPKGKKMLFISYYGALCSWAITCSKNNKTGEQMTLWDMINKATKFEFSLFNMSQCVTCSPVWLFCNTWSLSCQGPIVKIEEIWLENKYLKEKICKRNHEFRCSSSEESSVASTL